MPSAPESKSRRRPTRRAIVALTAALALPLLVLLSGCGSEDGGPAEPTGLRLVLDASRVQVTREVGVEAVSLYPLRDSAPCDWYVNDVLGGNATHGTITQTNPGTYAAPATAPAGGRVTIKAVSRSNSSHTDTDTLAVAFTMAYVDPENGSDDGGDGTWISPYKTLGLALWLAVPGDTVFALPGSYDTDNGEFGLFPIPDGASLVGASRESCLLYGSGSEFRIVDLGDGATLESVTVRNGGDDQIGVLSMGGGTIRNVAINEPFDYAAIRADGSRGGRLNDVVIEDCVLDNLSSPLTGRALELYYGSHCTVRDCVVSGWQDGIYANRDSDPLIERTSITGNVFGVIASGGGGLLTEPDLGGGARGSQGGNTIRDNTLVGLSNQTAAGIWAVGNTWSNDPPAEGPPYPADFQNTAGGSVVWAR